MNMNLSKLWESQRLGLNTTFLFCSPLTLRRSCFSLNFCPCLPETFKTYSLSCCHLFASSSAILFLVNGSTSGFFQFSISLEVDVFASRDTSPTPPTIYQNGGWIRSPPPAKAKFQLVEFGMEEPGGSRGRPRSPTPIQGQGKGHYEGNALGDTGAGREWVSGGGRAPQNPRTWKRTWPPGAEKARLRTTERKYPPRGREFYAVQEVQRGQ